MNSETPDSSFVQQIKTDVFRMLIGNVLHFHYDPDNDLIGMVDQGGFFLTRAEFEELFDELRAWYDTLTDEDIEHYNRQRLEHLNPRPKELRGHRARVPRPGQVYLARADNGVYKIGYSRNALSRVKSFSAALPYKVELVHIIHSHDAYRLEQALHERFASVRRGGEWFALTDEDVSFIINFTEDIQTGTPEQEQ